MNSVFERNPQFLFLSVNEVCNLRCRHCEYWTVSKPRLSTTSLPRQLEIVEEFSELSPGGTVVICGGEPMLDIATYFEVCRKCRSLGLRTLSVTNGTLVTTPADANRVIADGPNEVSVSLDSPDAYTHDSFRGLPGSYAAATNAVKLLLASRKLLGRPTKIYVMGLLSASSAERLHDFYDLILRGLGADKLKLNALQPSFINTSHPRCTSRDRFFETESQVDPSKLADTLATCNLTFQLHLNPKWISQVVSYFRALWNAPNLDRGWGCGITTDEVICNSGERNIMVDVEGRASLCFSNHFPGMKLERRGDLASFWRSPGCRDQMSRCRAPCGISHSVRREHATLR